MTTHADFLIELGTEELPPKALKSLQDAFAEGLLSRLGDAGLNFGAADRFGAPRRLAVVLKDLELKQPDEAFERRGPAVKAAFDADGNPTKAAEGFARSNGVSVDQLERMETSKGEWLVYRGVEPGRATKDLLPDLVQATLDALPIPKRMRWGASRDEFVRPVQWLVMLLGDDVVPASIYGIEADRFTRGHRFHAPDPIRIKRPTDYADVLKEQGWVLASFDQRRATIAEQAKVAAEAKGVTAVIDDDLLDEVTALNEWPVALVGQFDERFLDVPAEALVSSMQEHQKYFPTMDEQGRLASYFVFIANLESKDPSQVISGNEKVIRPRLADAAFFWDTDRKTPLVERVEKLKSVTFQQKLGSLHDKAGRLKAIAGEIARRLGDDVEVAERAAWLAKADLVTDMVFEFDDMQGIAGYYYALHDGEPDTVARAILEQYKPAGAGDELPTSRAGMAVALADRLDNLAGLFGIGQPPTGTKDPFALRRAALGVLRILVERELDLDLHELVAFAADQHANLPQRETVVDQVVDYALDRFSAWYQDDGFRPDVFQAVRALNPSRPLDIDRRVKAVAGFSAMAQAEALAAANKRVANLLNKAGDNLGTELAKGFKQGGPAWLARQANPSLFVESAETTLWDAIETAEHDVAPMLDKTDYQGALQRLATLRDEVDAYFDQVMVMAEDPAVRANRLAVLARLRQLFLQVADISVLQQ
ncbi:glycine--tRNA ligase subunit beta [Saccharospirillum salsuginis]|uniref:Glycine--tRNA ligase beta subunit n=1 Tax=Saccharospirillum salsuginis TaxID=418750 RepID=A0A918N8S5_9GAMM|nr:glycine--tRNA ligase subunit beta [Saccharospirillum salsuginis]GGX49376.1 glycine--tRNA ligase beta subunit [Saccharospirillum salsuginis]